MRQKITVYGLRFSKTTFWNRINTGFLGPAVATVLTACGMRPRGTEQEWLDSLKLQQCLPLAVCDHGQAISYPFELLETVATVLTACGMRPGGKLPVGKAAKLLSCNSAYRLRYATQYQYRYNAILHGCNSAYRLRYATKGARKQRSDDEVRTSLVPDRREGKTIKME